VKQIRREKITAFLKGRDHRHHNEYYPLAWNIKMNVYNWNPDGRTWQDGLPILIEGRPNQERYDRLWKEFVYDHTYIDEDVREEMLQSLLMRMDFEYDVILTTFGKSGGWLAIHQAGESMPLCNLDLESALRDQPYLKLWNLYKAVLFIDAAVEGRFDEYEFQMALRRRDQEDWWDNQEEIAGEQQD
jgi:hypothetical protein